MSTLENDPLHPFDITKARVIIWLKNRGHLYNSIHVIEDENQQEVYINNFRVLSRSSVEVPIPEDEIDLYLTTVSDFWNGSAAERLSFQTSNPFHQKKLPK